MATAAMTAVFPAPGVSYPGSVGRGVLTDRGCGKPRLDLDFTLVERCLSGDATGWEELVRLHTRRVYGLCYRFTGSDTGAGSNARYFSARVPVAQELPLGGRLVRHLADV